MRVPFLTMVKLQILLYLKLFLFFDKRLKQNVACKQSAGEIRCNEGLM